MPVRICWISSTPNCVTHLHFNLDDITILDAAKCVTIPASSIQLGILGGIFLLLFFIATVTSCRLLYIPPRAVIVTISFLFGLCSLLGDVGVSFSTHLFHLAWVEASSEILAVHSIEEQSIGAHADYPYATTTASPSPYSTLASSMAFNCWYPSLVSPASLIIVVLCDYEGFSDLVCQVGHSAKPISKLVVLDLVLGQRDVQIILNLDPIYQ